MFPLSKRKLIRGAMAHIKAGLGAGADYEAVYTGFKIPFDGIAKKYHGTEGGNWLRVTRPNGDQIELAHLSEYQVSDGTVKEGQNGGITGNTGSITTGPHLHIQIIRSGKRLDPEKYDWGDSKLNDGTMFRTYQKTIYLLVAGYWLAVATSYEQFLADFGGVTAPEMTTEQFKAYPVTRPTIK